MLPVFFNESILFRSTKLFPCIYTPTNPGETIMPFKLRVYKVYFLIFKGQSVAKTKEDIIDGYYILQNIYKQDETSKAKSDSESPPIITEEAAATHTDDESVKSDDNQSQKCKLFLSVLHTFSSFYIFY